MKNIVIYYSEFNIDSALAAVILRDCFSPDKECAIELISYNRSTSFKPPSVFDTVYIVGPVFHSLHIETLMFKNPDATVIVFNVNNALDYKIEIQRDIKIINSPIHDEDNSLKFKELTTLVMDSLELYQPSTNLFASKDFKELLASIFKYKRFHVLKDVQELSFTQQCMELIKDSIDDNKPLSNIPINTVAEYKENKKHYNKHAEKIRNIINRNFTLKTLVSGSTLLTVPILNASEENAIAVMRIVSYSYDNVITYEDTATHRLYRAYSTKNKDWLIKCVKPHDHWYEGEVLLMKTDVPFHENK
jgi:hypothetical protein